MTCLNCDHCYKRGVRHAVVFVALLTWVVIGIALLSACSSAPVYNAGSGKKTEGPQSLRDMGANPSALRSLRECEGRWKPEWCPR